MATETQTHVESRSRKNLAKQKWTPGGYVQNESKLVRETATFRQSVRPPQKLFPTALLRVCLAIIFQCLAMPLLDVKAEVWDILRLQTDPQCPSAPPVLQRKTSKARYRGHDQVVVLEACKKQIFGSDVRLVRQVS